MYDLESDMELILKYLESSAQPYFDGPDCHRDSQEISVNGSTWWGESSALQGKQ